MDEYPDDADGDALRRVAALGVDMTRPMAIDFFVAVPDREAGEAVALAAAGAGFRVEVEYDDDADAWTCYCSKALVPTYANVVAAQRALDDLATPHGGVAEGWGTDGVAVDD